MGFVSKIFRGPDNKALIAAQKEQLEHAREATRRQADIVAEKERKTAAAEAAQRAIRAGRRRGLLSFTEDDAKPLGG